MPNYILKNKEYLCVQKEDAKEYLTPQQYHMLLALVGMIGSARTVNKKSPLRLAIKDLREPSNVG